MIQHCQQVALLFLVIWKYFPLGDRLVGSYAKMTFDHIEKRENL